MILRTKGTSGKGGKGTEKKINIMEQNLNSWAAKLQFFLTHRV